MLRVRGGAPRRVGIQSHKPSPAGVLELVKRQLGWRGAVLPWKPQRKVWLFVSSGRSPGGVGLRRRATTPRALAEPGGFLERALLGGVWVHQTECRAEVTNQPAGRSWEAQTCRTTPTQLFGWRARRENNHF